MKYTTVRILKSPVKPARDHIDTPSQLYASLTMFEMSEWETLTAGGRWLALYLCSEAMRRRQSELRFTIQGLAEKLKIHHRDLRSALAEMNRLGLIEWTDIPSKRRPKFVQTSSEVRPNLVQTTGSKLNDFAENSSFPAPDTDTDKDKKIQDTGKHVSVSAFEKIEQQGEWSMKFEQLGMDPAEVQRMRTKYPSPGYFEHIVSETIRHWTNKGSPPIDGVRWAKAISYWLEHCWDFAMHGPKSFVSVPKPIAKPNLSTQKSDTEMKRMAEYEQERTNTFDVRGFIREAGLSNKL